jgi:anthranilate/para-aminobenzoate synthase component II
LPLEGVQFHPESILTMEDNHGLRLLANLLEDIDAMAASS